MMVLQLLTLFLVTCAVVPDIDFCAGKQRCLVECQLGCSNDPQQNSSRCLPPTPGSLPTGLEQLYATQWDFLRYNITKDALIHPDNRSEKIQKYADWISPSCNSTVVPSCAFLPPASTDGLQSWSQHLTRRGDLHVNGQKCAKECSSYCTVLCNCGWGENAEVAYRRGKFKRYRYSGTVRAEICEDSYTFDKVCTCPHGTPADKHKCRYHHTTQCVRCVDGYFLHKQACYPNVCVCENGTPVDSGSTQCVNNMQNSCSGCNANHHFIGERVLQCKANVCVCENGTPVNSTLCVTHLDNACSTCARNYHLVGDEVKHCKVNVCECKNGTPVESTACGKHMENACSACTGNYNLVGGDVKRCEAIKTTGPPTTTVTVDTTTATTITYVITPSTTTTTVSTSSASTAPNTTATFTSTVATSTTTSSTTAATTTTKTTILNTTAATTTTTIASTTTTVSTTPLTITTTGTTASTTTTTAALTTTQTAITTSTANITTTISTTASTTSATTNTPATTSSTNNSTTAKTIEVCGTRAARAPCTCVGASSSICALGATCVFGMCIAPICGTPYDMATFIKNANCKNANQSCEATCASRYSATGSEIVECSISINTIPQVPACTTPGMETIATIYAHSTIHLTVDSASSARLLKAAFHKSMPSSIAASLDVAVEDVEVLGVTLYQRRRLRMAQRLPQAHVVVDFRANIANTDPTSIVNTILTEQFKTNVSTTVKAYLSPEEHQHFSISSVKVSAPTMSIVYEPPKTTRTPVPDSIADVDISGVFPEVEPATITSSMDARAESLIECDPFATRNTCMQSGFDAHSFSKHDGGYDWGSAPEGTVPELRVPPITYATHTYGLQFVLKVQQPTDESDIQMLHYDGVVEIRLTGGFAIYNYKLVNGTTVRMQTSQRITAGWHHFVFTSTSGETYHEFEIYVDGVSQSKTRVHRNAPVCAQVESDSNVCAQGGVVGPSERVNATLRLFNLVDLAPSEHHVTNLFKHVNWTQPLEQTLTFRETDHTDVRAAPVDQAARDKLKTIIYEALLAQNNDPSLTLKKNAIEIMDFQPGPHGVRARRRLAENLFIRYAVHAIQAAVAQVRRLMESITWDKELLSRLKSTTLFEQYDSLTTSTVSAKPSRRYFAATSVPADEGGIASTPNTNISETTTIDPETNKGSADASARSWWLEWLIGAAVLCTLGLFSLLAYMYSHKRYQPHFPRYLAEAIHDPRSEDLNENRVADSSTTDERPRNAARAHDQHEFRGHDSTLLQTLSGSIPESTLVDMSPRYGKHLSNSYLLSDGLARSSSVIMDATHVPWVPKLLSENATQLESQPRRRSSSDGALCMEDHFWRGTSSVFLEPKQSQKSPSNKTLLMEDHFWRGTSSLVLNATQSAAMSSNDARRTQDRVWRGSCSAALRDAPRKARHVSQTKTSVGSTDNRPSLPPIVSQSAHRKLSHAFLNDSPAHIAHGVAPGTLTRDARNVHKSANDTASCTSTPSKSSTVACGAKGVVSSVKSAFGSFLWWKLY